MKRVAWRGRILSIQPRIRLTRSYDERYHTYLGYALWIEGTVEGEGRDFWVGIGKETQAKYQFRAGDEVSGEARPVADPRLETVEFYRASRLRVLCRAEGEVPPPPPWQGVPPDLETYRERGHRRLAVQTYKVRCKTCIWGCRMAVAMIPDHWKPEKKVYRAETFCYGPKSCPFYRPGPPRQVPGRRGSMWVEEDWVDEAATAHRGPDE